MLYEDHDHQILNKVKTFLFAFRERESFKLLKYMAQMIKRFKKIGFYGIDWPILANSKAICFQSLKFSIV